MRIVYVLTTLAMGGTEKQVLAIAERMAARGHTVALLVLKPLEPDGCTSHLQAVHLDIRKNPLSFLAGLRGALKFLHAFRPGLIHSHNFHGNMLARLLRVFHSRAKLISTIHNVYEGRRLRMLAYRASDWLVDRTTAVSTEVAERYIRLKAVRRAKCVVLTNGIDTHEFQPDARRRATMRAQMGVSDSEFIWLTVGRITAAKDLPNLLQAFAEVTRSGSRAQLWIAGEAPTNNPAKLGTGMSDRGAGNVRCLGLRRDIPALLDAADAFVLSSAWEGMPLSLGEAMAMEKPVVATDVGGVLELLGETGILVPAKDPIALARAMLDLVQLSAEQRAAMGRSARERIRARFAIDDKANAWEALYRFVLEGECL